MAGLFKYEDCLLKHYIRTNVWLPLCKDKLAGLRKAKPKHVRPLRYFTFCAVGAIDVLMLGSSKVLRRKDGRFDAVVFFDKDEELVRETQKRIPGATGFPADFVDVVLHDDPYENFILEGQDQEDPLNAPKNKLDTLATRKQQSLLSHKRKFMESFPFDVINLDLEEYLLKPKENIPGKLIRCLSKLLTWQKQPLPSGHHISEFSLMFTAKLGPPNLTEDYLAMLRDNLHANLARQPHLTPILEARSGTANVDVLQQGNFEMFFKLSVPKLLAATILHEDWYVDSDYGIQVFEFERDPDGDGQKKYKMLHLAMKVKRQEPIRENRAPGTQSQNARDSYNQVTERLFADAETIVSAATIDSELLQANLDKIKEYRKGICGEC